MTKGSRVITSVLPHDLALRLDETADRIDRSRSWIVREALSEWLSMEQRRYELTVEALKDVDDGRIIDHELVLDLIQEKKRQRSVQRSPKPDRSKMK